MEYYVPFLRNGFTAKTALEIHIDDRPKVNYVGVIILYDRESALNEFFFLLQMRPIFVTFLECQKEE